ncbi:hypothetical protein EV132_103315 [Rhizobium sullae]|uniref:Uncharacterized protein n=1 Tax=Rhizobium sullae TaxID=50338 RepID=A0A4V2V9R2_RHISU|nr:hypothetical protein EV132_103315 [Rhizobium sullae]
MAKRIRGHITESSHRQQELASRILRTAMDHLPAEAMKPDSDIGDAQLDEVCRRTYNVDLQHLELPVLIRRRAPKLIGAFT